MKVTIYTLDLQTYEFEKVVQVTTTYVGDGEDDKKYNQTSIVYLDDESNIKKRVFRSDEITTCVVMEATK